jgi:peptidoglycan/xylan/chitin deacetylase (PgdA/CDA1 family)
MKSIYQNNIKKYIEKSLLGLDRMFPSTGIPILQYHRISNNFSEKIHTTTVKPDEFIKQMDYLVENNYRVIHLQDVLHLIGTPEVKKNKYIAITFDDGHKDNLQHAYPILQSRNFTATVFIVPGYVGEKGYFDDHGRVENGASSESARYYEFMSWNELRQISDVFKIESHTQHHLDLTTISDADCLRSELSDPIKSIEDNLGYTPRYLCYPYGKFNDKIMKMLPDLGYKAAFGSEYGVNSRGTNIISMHRNTVGMGIHEVQFRLLLSNKIRVYKMIAESNSIRWLKTCLK